MILGCFLLCSRFLNLVQISSSAMQKILFLYLGDL
jgi:hypothetical protein